MRILKSFVLSLCLALSVGAGALLADGGVVYENVAADGGAGIAFSHPDTARYAVVAAHEAVGVYTIAEFVGAVRPEAPLLSRGAPGVALLDYDGDGDLDIYATNTAGTANSLFSNQVVETGALSFVDVAAAAGVDAVDLDSTGTCFGDIDNDGDPDLYVLGTGMSNRLFENQGDGTFVEITASSGTGAVRTPTSCAMADFNNDGLLDIVVANTYEGGWSHSRPSFVNPPAGLAHHPDMEHNLLFLNTGDNVFADAGAAAGLENVSNMAGQGLTGAAFTWAVTAADYDLDGDVDILFGDNQGRAPADESQERGWLRLYQNDGTGTFHEVTYESHLNVRGAWMGLDWGDLNCDGALDFFATNTGYSGAGAPSRWFWGSPDGGPFTDPFADPTLEGVEMTPFGWGVSIFDYDNDGDSDIFYSGGMEFMQFIDASNGGVLLRNVGECSGRFQWDPAAITHDHYNRAVFGQAVGDLDMDGFEDVVTIAAFNETPGNLFPGTVFTGGATGAVFDLTAKLEVLWGVDAAAGTVNYLGDLHEFTPGDLAVEVATGNENNWVDIHLLGTAHMLSGAVSNRDGIGAVVSFTPDGGPTSIRPILGGSSYGSQDALSAHFGLGQAESGTVEVLWPGGVRNRVADVRAGERLVVPEIPCDIADRGLDPDGYHACVSTALADLTQAGVVALDDQDRFLRGAFSCAPNEYTLCLHGDRFQAQVEWIGDGGMTHAAHVNKIDDRSGLFTFFGDDSPIEIHVNVLDACSFSDHFWVHAAASTNVGYTLTVTDTEAGVTRSWENPRGQVAETVLDNSAFTTCP